MANEKGSAISKKKKRKRTKRESTAKNTTSQNEKTAKFLRSDDRP